MGPKVRTIIENSSQQFNVEEELGEALSQKAFSFRGDYYYSASHASSPNPCLTISGLGPVGLPLMGDYAKQIIASASPSFPRAGWTGDEKTVPGCWEIEASRISFLNPAWEAYVSQTLCLELYEALDASASMCKLELDRLLICEEGSLQSFTPSRVTFSPCHFDVYSIGLSPQKSSELFATVVVLLPSAYKDGQAILSHASRTTTVDFSAESSYASAVFAWYTEATCEIKPISTGYCLALRYGLVHAPSSTGPRPSLPDTIEAATLLRGVLCKWRNELDSNNDTKRRRLAYTLDHTYDLERMKGVSSLKGADAHRVRLLHEISGNLGFTLCLAYLKLDSNSIHMRDWHLKQLTDLKGDPLFGLTKSLKLPRKSVVEMAKYSRKNPYGYGNSSTKAKEDVHTVLMLIDEKNQDELRYDVDGLDAALQMLRERAQIPPTPDNKKWAKVIAEQKTNFREFTAEMFLTVLEYAVDWQDLELWKEMTDCSKWKLSNVRAESLLKARKTFSFERVRERLEILIHNSTTRLHGSVGAVEIITFVYDLLRQSPTEEETRLLRRWCRGAVRYVLRSYTPKDREDAATALQVLRLVGLDLFTQDLVPRIKEKTDLFDFWMGFHESLNEQRTTLLEDLVIARPEFVTLNAETASISEPPPGNSPTKAELLDDLILASLSAASLTWSEIPPLERDIYENMFGSDEERAIDNPTSQKIGRILQVIEHCLRCDVMNSCDTVLVKALDVSGNPFWHFSEFFVPLISRLRVLLEGLDQDIAKPPFANFLRKLISKYLSQVLGKPGPLIDIGLRRLGCDQSNCKVCKELDQFILSTKTEIRLYGAEDRRSNYHLQIRLGEAIDLCKYELDKSSYSRPLTITKHESVVRCSEWEYRLEGAKALLSSIGPEPVIASIMGERYGDVQDALLGRRKYVWDEHRDAQTIVANAPTPPMPTQGRNSGRPTPALQSTRVLRSKRKRGDA